MNIVSPRLRQLSGIGLTAKVVVVFTLIFGVNACGQKGNLIVEQPPEDIVTTQQKEAEETK